MLMVTDGKLAFYFQEDAKELGDEVSILPRETLEQVVRGRFYLHLT